MNWDKIIVYYDIPYKYKGVFWIHSNKIYIYDLVKNYTNLHNYVVRHEKWHYRIHNSDRKRRVKIFLEIMHEWLGSIESTFNIFLICDKIRFDKEISNRNINNIITDEDIFRELLNEEKPAEDELRYSEIVRIFRPDSRFGKTVDTVLTILLINFIIKIIFGVNILAEINSFLFA